ncbi:hypothetical protein GOB94_13825 [Granulicella sp. 5B5]|uniref:universal stress protein n=1 Tax=Granulicella sp. 5B5 TaxID=1617967 RepID=UPI0015F3F8D1|nr:universal stress protein [Granulicella sp. 5B5]QMV19646.1 hypothetical protein GOB94_13825 [Granulicella sp. 5B5]
MPVIEDDVILALDQVVLATDFSPSAVKATEYAEGLAKRFSSKLALAHVVDLSLATRADGAVVGFPLDALRKDGRENLDRLQYNLDADGVKVSSSMLEAHLPAAAIVEYAEGVKADLIVTGTNARQGLSKAILGSCAEGIIRHARCPVLTVGPQARVAPTGPLSFRTVLFGTDFSREAVQQARLALRFAQDSYAKLYLCHVLEKRAGVMDLLGDELRFQAELSRLVPQSAYDWCSREYVVESGTAAPHILQLAKRIDADLIVLGSKHSATWLTHLVEGTVGHVLRDAQCPVLTMHDL